MTDFQKCIERVKDICNEYKMNIIDISTKEIEPHDIYKEKQYVIEITTDCDDDLLYDIVYTKCVIMNEESFPNLDLTVALNDA